MEKTPFQIHVFVCKNTRPDQPERKSCGGEVSANISQGLKDFLDEHSLNGKVRITTTNCLGPCAKGPNVMIYPQELFFSGCSDESLDEIKQKILSLMDV